MTTQWPTEPDEHGNYGYLVVRRDVPNETPFEVGDKVTTYALGEPLPGRDLPPHSGHTTELAAYHQAVVEAGWKPDDWRVQRVLRCTCQSRPGIALLQVHEPTARLWVMVKAESIPTAFRADDHGNDGWPLHGNPGEAPHVGAVASCKGCDRRWLVVSTVDDAVMVRINSATHGANVAP